MDRPRFHTRSILLLGPDQLIIAQRILDNAPQDPLEPIEVVFRERLKKRTLDQNAHYWVRVGEISEQAWIEGRRYSDEVLHEHFKREFLPDPEIMEPEEIEKRARPGYRKWEADPNGERMCVGSTTGLTKFGFAEYVQRVEAFGAGLGVRFSAQPSEFGGNRQGVDARKARA